MTDEQKMHFDMLVGRVLERLPSKVRDIVDEVALIVDDHPDTEMMESLRDEGVMEEDAEPDELMGLHTGVPLTERGINDTFVDPPQVHIFRESIVAEVGGWEVLEAEMKIEEEIRKTILHEIGHHFGLDEDDLERLGYA